MAMPRLLSPSSVTHRHHRFPFMTIIFIFLSFITTHCDLNVTVTSLDAPKSNKDASKNVKFAKIIDGAVKYALKYQDELKQLEEDIMTKGYTTDPDGDAALRYYKIDPLGQQWSRHALVHLAATRYLTFQVKPSFENFLDFELVRGIDLGMTPLQGFCRAVPTCRDITIIDGIEYRTIDGSCNNRLNPAWGMSKGKYYREILSAVYYDDLYSSPRTVSVDRFSKLPSAREVSYKLLPDRDDYDQINSMFLMQFGQLVSHDFTSIAVLRPLQVQQVPLGYDCCHPHVRKYPNYLHPECFAIEVKPNDPFYGPLNVTCLNFLRASPVPWIDCAVGMREQMNMATGFLDLSVIYGSDTNRAHLLRSWTSGRMDTSVLNSRSYPPLYRNYTECDLPQDGMYSCFKTGDDRGNMHLQLVAFQVIFLRLHNLIVTQLKGMHPDWTDEHLYQEGRRINIALYQHVTYQEMLPSYLGVNSMAEYNLWPTTDAYSTGYSQLLEPSAGLAASTSAFRLHTLIQGKLGLFSKWQSSGSGGDGRYVNRKVININETYFNPTHYYKKSTLDGVIDGMTIQSMSKMDRFLTSQVSEDLFKRPGSRHGMDLAAIDIQRGRDVGLSGYNSWINFCGMRKARHFPDLKNLFEPDFVQMLSSLYTNVDDIDFWAAAVNERPRHADGILGPTFECVVADQFARMKFGDRFWYENPTPGVAFSHDQLMSIKSITMTRIICETSDGIKFMNKNPFKVPSPSNPRVSCTDFKSIPPLNLEPWRRPPDALGRK